MPEHPSTLIWADAASCSTSMPIARNAASHHLRVLAIERSAQDAGPLSQRGHHEARDWSGSSSRGRARRPGGSDRPGFNQDFGG